MSFESTRRTDIDQEELKRQIATALAKFEKSLLDPVEAESWTASKRAAALIEHLEVVPSDIAKRYRTLERARSLRCATFWVSKIQQLTRENFFKQEKIRDQLETDIGLGHAHVYVEKSRQAEEYASLRETLDACLVTIGITIDKLRPPFLQYIELTPENLRRPKPNPSSNGTVARKKKST